MSGSSQGSGSPIRGRDLQRGSSTGAQGQSFLGNIDGLNIPNKRHQRHGGSPPQNSNQQLAANYTEPNQPNLDNMAKIN